MIVDASVAVQQMVDASEQTSFETARHSLDATEIVFSYEGPQPAAFAGYRELSHEEALSIMASAAWTANPDSTYSLWSTVKSFFGY